MKPDELLEYAAKDPATWSKDEVRRLLREAATAITKQQQDAERYRWLREHYASADFEPRGHAGMDLIFSVPQGAVSGNCDKTIDGLMEGANYLIAGSLDPFIRHATA